MTEGKTTVQDLIDGLVRGGGTPNLGDYVYAGGDEDVDLAYFNKRYCGRRRAPEKHYTCVCTHAIGRNCYIENTETKMLYVVGSSCVRRFQNRKSRTCSLCGTIHKHRKDNLCIECRKKYVFVNVSFAQKEDAKRLGAQWNPTVRMWWVHPSNADAINKFGRFI